jgi:hypothetical protein
MDREGWLKPIFPLFLKWLLHKLKFLIATVDLAPPVLLAKLRLSSNLYTLQILRLVHRAIFLEGGAVESVHKSADSDSNSDSDPSIFKTSDSDSSIFKTPTPTPTPSPS